jgi:hypothetical protein
MKIQEIIENEDGSATVIFDLTSEELQLIVNTTITKALVEFIENIEKSPITISEKINDDENQAHLGNTEY